MGNRRALPVEVPYPPWLLLLVLRVPQATDTQLSRRLLDFPPTSWSPICVEPL